MNKKQIALLFLITLIPFLIFSVGRPDFVGGDSYFFLNHVCGEGELGEGDLVRAIFGWVPCNFILIKTLLFLLCLSCVFAIALTGNLLYDQKGWMAGLFIFLAPVFFSEFTKFENDQFAYPLIFLSIYFYYKGFFKNSFINRLTAISLLVFAAQIWGGAAFFIPAFAFGSILFILTTIPLLAIYWKHLLFAAWSRFPELDLFGRVWENSLVVGIAYLCLLPLGYNGINKMILPQLVFFTALMLLNSKFVFLLTPFLALGFVGYFNKLDYSKYGKNFKQIFLWLPFFMAISWGFVSLTQPPLDYQWEAVEFALQESERPGITNDWDLGHWIYYKGGRTELVGGPQDFNISEGIILSRKELPCPMLREFNELKVYRCG